MEQLFSHRVDRVKKDSDDVHCRQAANRPSVVVALEFVFILEDGHNYKFKYPLACLPLPGHGKKGCELVTEPFVYQVLETRQEHHLLPKLPRFFTRRTAFGVTSVHEGSKVDQRSKLQGMSITSRVCNTNTILLCQ